MAAEEEKGDGSSPLPIQRQRFYVELKYGETTIVSYKRLLREAKEKEQQCSLTSSGAHSSSSAAPETVRKTMDIRHDASHCNDSVIGNEKVKHVNRSTSFDHMQQNKHRVKTTIIEGEKNDGDSSIKLAEPNKMNAKVTLETMNLFKHSSSLAMVNDHPPQELQASMVDAPVLTYSRKPANVRSKSKCPPSNAVEDVYEFPSKTMHNVVQKNQKISSGKSKMKVGVGGSSFDVMHQKNEGCSPVKISSTSGKLSHEKVSSKSCHNDKSGAVPPCYNSPLKDSKAEKFKEIKNEIFAMVSNQPIEAAYVSEAKEEQMFAKSYILDEKLEDKLCDLYELCFQGLGGDKDVQVQKLYFELAEIWPKGVMDHLKLTEAISRAKRRRALAAKNRGHNMVDTAKIKHVRPPCQKRKVIDCNSIPSLTRKTSPKKAAIQQPALQCNSPDSLTKGVKLTLKQQKTNVKVRFLLKPEHETPNFNEKSAEDMSKQSSIAALVMHKQPDVLTSMKNE